MANYKIETKDLKSGKSANQTFDSIEISDNLTGNTYLLMNNQKKDRVVYSFTKSRSDFTSGGAKPYKQKGTGRARLGTNRSPLKVGGSVIFGPKPRIVKRKSNKLFFVNTIKQLLLSKLDQSFLCKNIEVIEKAAAFSKQIDSEKSYLFILNITQAADVNLFNRIKNISNIYFNNVNSIVVEDLIRADEVIYTDASFNQLFSDLEDAQ
ncbi:MAG: 50S ribosomal protein L4 [Candidatus Margulisiibacteriota bacterium]